MDIASRPSEPVADSFAPDAAAPPSAPPVIRREDYLPPAWLVPETALDFTLGIDATHVVSRLTVTRNPDGNGSDILRLNGDNIAPLHVFGKVDGRQLGPAMLRRQEA